MSETVKRTPLHSLHRRLGARMTRFAGFEMPLSYRGIIPEHQAVRSAAGIFDLSHMGEFELRGSSALAVLQRTLTNSANRLSDGQAQYTLMCAEDGGTLDDLIVYRIEAERFMLCVNAANIESDREWLLQQTGPGAELIDLSEDMGLIAIQGPSAAEILSRVAQFQLSAIRRYHARSGKLAEYSCRYPLDSGVGVLVSNGVGFTLAEFEAFVSRPRAAPSNARRAVLRGTKAALTGPLARYALCGRSLHPAALRAARLAGLTPGERNPYHSALIRAVELVHALEEAASLIDRFPPSGPDRLALTVRSGRGVAAAEAPTGLVYQRYDLLPDGTVGGARVIGPDELNRNAIELDVRRAEREARRRDPEIDRTRLDALRTELVDNYEPGLPVPFPALDRSGG